MVIRTTWQSREDSRVTRLPRRHTKKAKRVPSRNDERQSFYYKLFPHAEMMIYLHPSNQERVNFICWCDKRSLQKIERTYAMIMRLIY